MNRKPLETAKSASLESKNDLPDAPVAANKRLSGSEKRFRILLGRSYELIRVLAVCPITTAIKTPEGHSTWASCVQDSRYCGPSVSWIVLHA